MFKWLSYNFISLLKYLLFNLERLFFYFSWKHFPLSLLYVIRFYTFFWKILKTSYTCSWNIITVYIVLYFYDKLCFSNYIQRWNSVVGYNIHISHFYIFYFITNPLHSSLSLLILSTAFLYFNFIIKILQSNAIYTCFMIIVCKYYGFLFCISLGKRLYIIQEVLFFRRPTIFYLTLLEVFEDHFQWNRVDKVKLEDFNGYGSLGFVVFLAF